MKGKLHKLEAIRGFAALYVVGSHLFDREFYILGHNLAFLFKFGQEAVTVFFVLSGFVIQYSFARSRDKSFTVYFMKRFTRIYIPLFVVYILSYILYENFSTPRSTPLIPHLIGNVFMLQDIYSAKPNVICDPF
jgi:peptidoglycan/LPS O-acetylase OafA/YrhL